MSQPKPKPKRIQRIKITAKGVAIQYQERGASGRMEVLELHSEDRAAPSFYESLQALRPHLLQLAELPEDWGKGLFITGVSITKDLEYIITAERLIYGAEKPLVLRTPRCIFLGEAKEDFERACAEAEAYVRGERAQQMIPFTPED